MRIAAQAGVPHVHIHCFMDGRDVPPSSGAEYIADLQAHIDALADTGCDMHIASISGRYYAMDRDNRWDRIERAYHAVVDCAPRADCDPATFMKSSYAADVTDEFVVPAAFTDRGVHEEDAVIFFNFRPDRARQITHTLTDREFSRFDRGIAPRPFFVCLTEYDPEIDAHVAYAKEFPDEVLADVLAEHGLRQYHIAETEKYAHVTFFLNGGREAEKVGEERALIASPKVATYDLQPRMSEPEVAQTLADAIDADESDFYIVNFANCDMVGHTGSIPAAIEAVEAVDAGVAKVLAALERKRGIALITADHGNADKMIDTDGEPFTAHTTNPVPLILVDYAQLGYTFGVQTGALCNIAPTLLDMAGIPKPAQMDADSLLYR
jgi:2,3-bisphosphoglycerate-independent phosphoglycerate mutase